MHVLAGDGAANGGGVDADFSATSLIIMGLSESRPWARNSVWRRTMA